MKIIHIVGSIGSNKKEIENVLRKEDNLIVINLNDIEDFYFVNQMKTNKKFYNMVSENKIKIWKQNINKGIDKIINQYLKLTKKNNKNLVIINNTNLNNNFLFINKINFDKKFYINTPFDLLFRLYSAKIIKKIKNNQHELNEMYKHQPKLHLIQPISYYKMKIKGNVIQSFDEFVKLEKDKIKFYSNKNYNFNDSNHIINIINKL